MDSYIIVDECLFLEINVCCGALSRLNNEEMYRTSILSNVKNIYLKANSLYQVENGQDDFYLKGLVKATYVELDFTKPENLSKDYPSLEYCEFSTTNSLAFFNEIENGTNLKRKEGNRTSTEYQYCSYLLFDDFITYCLETGLELDAFTFMTLLKYIYNDKEQFVDATFKEKMELLPEIIEFKIITESLKKPALILELNSGLEMLVRLLPTLEGFTERFGSSKLLQSGGVTSANPQEVLQAYDAFQQDNIPTNLYMSYSLFTDVWERLPDDMNKPTKSELQKYLFDKGFRDKNQQVTINAIIKISTPDDRSFGGKKKANLRPWDINKY
jgi:hypothetical protein